MTTIINNVANDPFKNDLDYQEVSRDNFVIVNGQHYIQKIVYEKRVELSEQIGKVFFALLTTLALIPCIFYPSYVSDLWKQAIAGVDRQVVLIEQIDNTNVSAAINFGAGLPPAIVNITSYLAQDISDGVFYVDPRMVRIDSGSSYNGSFSYARTISTTSEV